MMMTSIIMFVSIVNTHVGVEVIRLTIWGHVMFVDAWSPNEWRLR